MPGEARQDGVEMADHIASLERDGQLMAAAAERAGLRASVPSCPGWQVRDLLRHQGYVHRWATRYVAEQLSERVPRLTEAELLADGPPDDELVDWFRAGHAALVSSLRAADPAMRCWTFLDAPTPLAFWARRQAHETAIHRVDAELAQGGLSPVGAEFAADGIDELIMGFCGRDATGLADAQRAEVQRLQVQAIDTAGEWQVELTEDGTRAASVRRGNGNGYDNGNGNGNGNGAADCTLTGPAAGLYLVLWNRAEPGAATEVSVGGDAAVLRAWRDSMRVTWA
jgi:uncharacterized protein (TIGR03083 family)